jgi:hypothetical protein
MFALSVSEVFVSPHLKKVNQFTFWIPQRILPAALLIIKIWNRIK